MANTAFETKYKVRPASPQDLPALVDLLNASALATVGRADTDEAYLRGVWEEPGFEVETDTMVVYDQKGELVGYHEFQNDREEHANFDIDCYVKLDHPEAARIAGYLFERAEQHARQESRQAQPGAEVYIQQVVWSNDELFKEVLTTKGFELTRHYLRMELDLDTPPPVPVWPDGISVRTFVPGQDEEITWRTREETFLDMWGHTPRTFDSFIHTNITAIPDFDPNLWFLAMDKEEVAGVCLCFPTSSEDPDTAYLRSLGVRRPWRKLGLGMALLQHAFGEMYRRGKSKIWLGVDATSLTGATRLYERAGMHQTRRADFYRKTLK